MPQDCWLPDVVGGVGLSWCDGASVILALGTGSSSPRELRRRAITWERFDLVVRRRDYLRPPPQAFFGFVRSEAFAARAHELGGYDVADAGVVRHAP